VTARQLFLYFVFFLIALITIVQPSFGQTPATDVVLYATHAPVKVGSWTVSSDLTAAEGLNLSNPDAGAAKISTALANPSSYVDFTFSAQAGIPYRLWIRGKAQGDSPYNDSAHVQFSGSVTSNGTAVYRIGTTSSAVFNLEDCFGCGIQGWGWQDNGWGIGVLGPLIYFQSAGTQILRIQTREDGLSIDQIVLSPSTYLFNSPGALRNDTVVLPLSNPTPTPTPEPAPTPTPEPTPTPTPEPTPTPTPSNGDYYVNALGSDSNPGTLAFPFRTIQRAADVVSPGDTVIVQDGTYTGTNLCSGNKAVVCLGRGGTATAKITFKSENKWGAKIDGQGVNNEGWYFLAAANYIRIEGFDVYGINALAADGGASGFVLYNGGHDTEIVGNNIHNIGNICTDTTKGQNAIFLQQPNVTIEKNVIHDIGRFAPGENGCNPSTAYYMNHDHGIYTNGATDSSSIPGANFLTVKNNIVYNIKRGWAMQLYPGSLTGVSILNNTFAFANPYRDGHILIDANLSATLIQNNIFYQPTNVAVRIPNTPTMTSVVVSSNLTTTPGIVTKTLLGLTVAGNWLSTDPRMVNTTIVPYDFKLNSLSSAVDGGTSISSVVDDYDGGLRPRGLGYDIGPYENGSLPNPSPTPTPTSTPSPTPLPSPSPTPNSPPISSITSPTNGSSFAGSNITITANASDSDGSIAKVDFYANGILIGTTTSNPFSIIWKNVPSGKYQLTAKATDNLGASTTSAPVFISKRKGR
jgi:hypothetical protein